VPSAPFPLSSSASILRGSSWLDNAGSCRSTFRLRSEPDYAGHYVGFRLVAPPLSSFASALVRGGSCNYAPWYCNSAFCNRIAPHYAGFGVGFRLTAPLSPSIASPSMPILSDACWESFSIDAAREVLDLPLGKQTCEWESPLDGMCTWEESPQGHDYWRDRLYGAAPLTAEDKAIIQGWVEAWEANQAKQAKEAKEAKEAPALSLREDALQALFDIALALPPDACVKDAMTRVKTALESLPL
jgi:hypothetical protein